MADFDEYKKTACGILLAGQARSFCEVQNMYFYSESNRRFY